MRSDFAYAQARMQARLGERLTPPGWRAVEGARSLAHYLEQARATALRRYLQRVHDAMTVHEIEQAMRAEAAVACGEVARWCPSSWRDAIGLLPALLELPLRSDGPSDDLTAGAATAWYAGWIAAMPGGRIPDKVAAFVGEVQATLAPPGGEGTATFPPRQALDRLLLRWFRAATATPVAVLAYLGFVFIDVERLRGGLVRRRLFASDEREEAA
jgi:hypothetical protein